MVKNSEKNYFSSIHHWGFFLAGFLTLYLVASIVDLIVGPIVVPRLEKEAAQAYLAEGREPNVAEIEQFIRMKLPRNYSHLKAFYHVENRDGVSETMKVKVSANRVDIEEVLSTAGLFRKLEKNPAERSISNGTIIIPWWNPDAEKNVLSAYYRWNNPKTKYGAWTLRILVALPEKGEATLYVHGLRY